MATENEATATAERLYYSSAELSFAAVVTDIRLLSVEKRAPGTAGGDSSQVWQVALDRTAFYPESGGQPADRGVLVATSRSGATLEVPVEDVQEDAAGEVWHIVRKPLVQGAAVEGRVDRDRRSDHMQQHSAQHLLSAVFLGELGARTVSFHLGAESSTIDLLLPEPSQGLRDTELRQVEERTNQLITENRSVRVAFVSRPEAEGMQARGDLRKLPERSGPMRLVEIDGVEFNACGGTHVEATGAIGAVLLRRVEKGKHGWRVEFVAGARAVRAAAQDFRLLAQSATSLSTSAADVPVRIAALLEDTKSAAKQVRASLEELAESRAEELVRAAAPGTVVQALYAEKTVDFAKRVASLVGRAGRHAVVGATHEGEGALVLARAAGSEVHAGHLLRAVLCDAGAKGGGSAELAQGVCGAAQVPALLETCANRLRRALSSGA